MADDPATTMVEAVRSVVNGEPVVFQNLTMVPLLGLAREPDYVVLDDALTHKWVEITESNEQGRVPELRIVNRGTMAVLLLDGEELLGAKQNRVLNLTMLIPPEHASVIPVSCVESGRWRPTSRTFVSAPRAQFAEGRAAKMRQVTDSLRASGARLSDQGEVWSAIAKKSARLRAESATAAMSVMFDKLDRPLEDFVNAFPPAAHQVGAVFLITGRLCGLELFDAPRTWRQLSSKLVRSYALDAIDHQTLANPPVRLAEAHALIDAITSSPSGVFPALGEGHDVRFNDSRVTGAALVARGRAIHVSAFSATPIA
jgi:hypothetical protein